MKSQKDPPFEDVLKEALMADQEADRAFEALWSEMEAGRCPQRVETQRPALWRQSQVWVAAAILLVGIGIGYLLQPAAPVESTIVVAVVPAPALTLVLTPVAPASPGPQVPSVATAELTPSASTKNLFNETLNPDPKVQPAALWTADPDRTTQSPAIDITHVPAIEHNVDRTALPPRLSINALFNESLNPDPKVQPAALWTADPDRTTQSPAIDITHVLASTSGGTKAVSSQRVPTKSKTSRFAVAQRSATNQNSPWAAKCGR